MHPRAAAWPPRASRPAPCGAFSFLIASSNHPPAMTPHRLLRTAALLFLLCEAFDAVAVTRIKPGADSEVVEVLPTITRVRPGSTMLPLPTRDSASVAEQARQAISVARQTGDTRYWGRAQALLAPWWDKSDAPVDLAVLQATVQQGRHEFDPARKVLAAALARSPGHAQGWLNLAALERLSARYAESLQACEAVARARQALYAQACRLETRSLQGETRAVTQGLGTLLADANALAQRSWLLSLLAEHLERSGDDAGAAKAYQDSLRDEPDLYTAIAYSDLLLRRGHPAQALQILAGLPETDAVLLRRAAAWRRSGDKHWLATRALLRERVAELTRRGDDPALHGRELALAALWLDDDAAGALVLARANLSLQREPLDWWVALTSARQANDVPALARIEASVREAGLHDVRLAVGSSAGAQARAGARP